MRTLLRSRRLTERGSRRRSALFLEYLEARRLLAGDSTLDDPLAGEGVQSATAPAVAPQPWLIAPPLPAPTGNVVTVTTESQLQQAVSNVTSGTTIVIAAGTYNLSSTLWVRTDNVTIRGETNNPADVVLVGRGMENSSFANVPHGVWSDASNLKVQNLTIRDVYHHPIQFDPGADSPEIYNVRLLDAGEQFIKASSGGFGVGVDRGLVQYTTMEYTAGPPQQNHGGGTGYTNGVDVHGGTNWRIRNNLFKNFHTPDSAQHRWNPAILMWNGASGTVSEGNTFINVDRAIAYGLVDRSPSDHAGGVIRNNFIYLQPGLYSAARRSSSDGQIIVWDSPSTDVLHNTILTNGNTNKSIEFRFGTNGGTAMNNLVDAPLGSRGGASFSQSGNVVNANSGMFVDPANGDLHLNSTAALAIDAVDAILSVPLDIDGQPRPTNARADAGADEYVARQPNNAPVATDDTQNVTEDANANPVSGNVLSNDLDADSDALTVVRVNGDANRVGQAVVGQYGRLTLSSSGSYDYTLDNANPAVNALDDGDSLVESFTYQMTDGTETDGATLTLTIHGTTDVGSLPRSDIAGFSAGGWSVARSTGQSFVTQVFAQPGSRWNDTLTADVNGDGIDDLVGRVGDQWWVGRSTGDAFVIESWGSWSDRIQWIDMRTADVDGNGSSDVVARTPTGIWWVARSTGSRFVNERWGKWSPHVRWDHVLAADFSGDGNHDIAGRTRGKWWVAVSNGNSFTNQRWGAWSDAVTWTNVNVADVNGDGMSDLLGMTNDVWWVARSNGNGFLNERWGAWSRSSLWVDIRVGDFDGDGQHDVAGRIQGRWWVARSTGTSFVNQRWGQWSPTVIWEDVLVGDFNGDGRDDIAGRTRGRWWVARSSGADFFNQLWSTWSANTPWQDVMVGDYAS